jgi:hypothetical protein
MAMDGLYADNAGAVVGDAMDGLYAYNAGAVAGVWPWMACMPATQEQSQAYGHGWPVCLQRRTTARMQEVRIHGWMR